MKQLLGFCEKCWNGDLEKVYYSIQGVTVLSFQRTSKSSFRTSMPHSSKKVNANLIGFTLFIFLTQFHIFFLFIYYLVWKKWFLATHAFQEQWMKVHMKIRGAKTNQVRVFLHCLRSSWSQHVGLYKWGLNL